MNFGFASEKDKIRSAFPEYFPTPKKTYFWPKSAF
jgi:hypothetical protein